MAKETRKLKRASEREGAFKVKKQDLERPLVTRAGMPPDPLGSDQLKSLALRLGIPIAAVWVVGILIAGVSFSKTTQAIALSVPAVISVAGAILVFWALKQAKKARGVASILSNVDTAEDRQAAIDKLSTGYKKNDPSAIFARAQLELQEDPDKALATLEQIDLKKVMAPVADEARAQRAMIHLMRGQVSTARQLVDGIELKRHQDARSRAMLAAVMAEAWARSGQAKKAVETLDVFDPDDAQYRELRPQLYRAYAYAHAHMGSAKGMRQALRKLLEHDARLLGAFLTKKTHPLLQKEAKRLLEQSGQVPRKMVVQRR